MTYGEFKKFIENKGAKDEHEIRYFDFSYDAHEVEIYTKEDGCVEIMVT